MTIDPSHFQRLLLTHKAELLEALERGREPAQVVTLDQQSVGRVSRGDALQQQSLALSAQRERTIKLRQIESALIRIDQEVYGMCLRCGEEIATGRLEVFPETPYCVSCLNGRV